MAHEVAIIGGSGHLGRRAADALARAEIPAKVLSRNTEPRVDLRDPSSFDALRGYELVIDLANATVASPVELARWCIENGLTFVETTSDAAAVRDLRDALAGIEGPGAAVLGAGIFTGLSNLLARAASNAVGGADRLELFISSSPFSGAGAATVDLMAAALARDAVSTVGGREVCHARVARGPQMPLPAGGRPSLRASFAEQYMLGRSTSARDVEVWFAPTPSILVPAFVATPRWLGASRPYRWAMRAWFRLLRGVLLRSTRSSVELVARAERSGERSQKRLSTPDGMAAGGAAIAAIAEALLRGRRPRGMKYVDDVCELDPIVRRANELGAVIRVSPAVAASSSRYDSASPRPVAGT